MDSDIEELAEKHGGYWKEHPDFPVEDWCREVLDDDTRRGYWEWVEAKLAHDQDPDPPWMNKCPSCGGPPVLLGTLGNTAHARCRNCGAIFELSRSEDPPDPALVGMWVLCDQCKLKRDAGNARDFVREHIDHSFTGLRVVKMHNPCPNRARRYKEVVDVS